MNQMWPASYTAFLLALGLLPLVYIAVVVLTKGLRAVATLPVSFVLTVWLGYHLTPWLHLSDGAWHSFLLVPDYIDAGLAFSTLAVASFLCGYHSTSLLPVPVRTTAPRHGIPSPLPSVSGYWLALSAAVTVLLFVVVVGGPEEALRASRSRGFGQFDERDVLAKIHRMATIALTVLSIVTAVLASLYVIVKRQKGDVVLFCLGWLCLFLASVNVFHGFSRGAGFAFVIFALLAFRLRGLRSAPAIAVALALALWLGFVGFTQRGDHYPGLANYASAAFTAFGAEPASTANEGSSLDTLATTLNAIDAWTLKAWAAEMEDPPTVTTALAFLWNLHPFPSELVPLKRVGADLSEIKGTVGSFGLTTPALGELYYTFGYLGAAFLSIIGYLSARAEARILSRPGVLSLICVLLFFVAFFIGLHHGFRAMTRPIWYALILCWIVPRISSYLGSARRRARHP